MLIGWMVYIFLTLCIHEAVSDKTGGSSGLLYLKKPLKKHDMKSLKVLKVDADKLIKLSKERGGKKSDSDNLPVEIEYLLNLTQRKITKNRKYGLYALTHKRSKRTLEDEEYDIDLDAADVNLEEFFANLKRNDDDTCLAKMVCEMATGNPAFGHFGREITELLLSLESYDPNVSWKRYKQAAMIGRRARSNSTCKRRYPSCDATFEELLAASRCLEQGGDCLQP
ncbi:uncharacterized protein LOC111626447 [Centruroides sculpturatus]|uniref:uncharacterized protein LOC111626447 n=1 Tax=Centruroides sculpturatus TaxID=218467 RepID=UPI000C6E7A94|nr:uncharacterized protein LOC111626447 [Centruroides sculpturatus]XP_023225586.1 uncharacterized protein LOC111626447 [Centruroides sculpturatus]